MTWFADVLKFHGIREVPVSSEIAVLSAGLPPLHSDPCDRIIIATARVNRMKILTCDRLIRQYDPALVVW